MVRGIVVPGVVTVQVMPATPWSAISVIRTSQSGVWPQRSTRKGSSRPRSRRRLIENGQPLRAEIFKDLALASRIPWRLPRFSMWASPMLEMNGDVGPHHLAQIPDLPEVVHAGLDHRRLMLRLRPSRVRGVPMSLLKFSGVFSTRSFAPIRRRSSPWWWSFPTEPVICTKGMGNRSR